MAGAIKFSREPYTVKYYDRKGELREIKRRPPKRLLDVLPKDRVILNERKNDDWPSGEIYTVKHINPKHPNTIQITPAGEDRATFVSALDLTIDSKVAARDGVDPRDEPINNNYLKWP